MPFQSRIRTGKRLFLVLSLLLIVTDGLFVWINRHSDQEQLHRQLDVESEHLRRLFETQLTATATRMQQTAAYIAMDRDVQQLFLKGQLAVEAEGGGTGGAKAAEARQALLQRLQGPWEKMQEEYDTRQLHFVFGEQATSFLRLHATERYGDPLAAVRFAIRDAIAQRKPTMGYESGRVFSGIRGVVPVFAHNQSDDTETFAGVLEAGTSFSVMLQQLEKASGTHFTVLLHRNHLQQILFPERLREAEASGHFHGDWFIESTTSANTRQLLDSPVVKASLAHRDVSILKLGNENFAIFTFPLRDYLGGVELQRPAAGTVLAWRSIDAEVAQQRHNLVVNLFYAFGAFLLIEILLYSGIRLTTRHLNGIIEQQTEELRKQAIHDRLTGLYNRHHLDEAFSRECARARRYREPLSIAILDLDHFKRVNDEHGHLVGDKVLADFAHLIGQNLRAADLVFRYGGEEFLILLANTPQHSAREACEHIRISLMESSVGGLPVGSVTVSVGVTTMSVDEPHDLGQLLQRADSALYRAKSSGRNRVEEEKPDSVRE
jgi:diguanylate cyclase (GGDEF)-like protein